MTKHATLGWKYFQQCNTSRVIIKKWYVAMPTVCLEIKSDNFQSRNMTSSMTSSSQNNCIWHDLLCPLWFCRCIQLYFNLISIQSGFWKFPENSFYFQPLTIFQTNTKTSVYQEDLLCTTHYDNKLFPPCMTNWLSYSNFNIWPSFWPDDIIDNAMSV